MSFADNGQKDIMPFLIIFIPKYMFIADQWEHIYFSLLTMKEV